MTGLHQAIKKERNVIIPKFLTTDPYNKRGQAGKIIGKDEYGDYIIKFNDGTIGLYDKHIWEK